MFFVNSGRLQYWLFISMLSILLLLILQDCTKTKESQLVSSSASNVMQLRFGHDMAQDSAIHLAAIKYAELVKQRSNGRVSIQIYPAQQLGTDHEMIAMAQTGELDIILPPSAKLSALVPAMQLFDMPFLFPTHESAYRILDNQPGLALLSKLKEHSLMGVAFWESGFKHLTANRPIQNMDDLKDMRFRIMRSQALKDQFAVWGAESIPINFSKAYQALVDGVVDGQENPLTSIYSMKLHRAQSHLILSGHGYLSQVLIFSKVVFDQLPVDVQDILVESAKDVTDEQRRQARRMNDDLLAKISETNIKIVNLPDKMKQKMRKLSRKVLEKHRLSIGTRLVELTLQALDEDKQFSKDRLVIALDADLVGNSAFSGLAIRRGIEIAIDEINGNGGVLGYQLALVARDNSMVSARGIDNIRRFSDIPNLVAVFGGISSPVVLSQLDLIHKKEILFLDPWAAATSIVDNSYDPNFVFRVSVRDEDAAGFLLPKALQVSEKVGLLLANNGWGRSNHRAFLKAFSELGLQPASEQWFDWGESRHEYKIDALYAAGAEVIIYVGNPVEAAAFVKIIANKKHKLPIISHWGITGADFSRLAGSALDNVDLRVLQTFSFIENNNVLAKSFVKKYQDHYQINSVESIISPTGTAHAYDLMHLLAKAITQAASIKMPAIRVAMENLTKHQGLLREYNPPFTPKDHDALDSSDFFLAKYQAGILVPLSSK